MDAYPLGCHQPELILSALNEAASAAIAIAITTSILWLCFSLVIFHPRGVSFVTARFSASLMAASGYRTMLPPLISSYRFEPVAVRWSVVCVYSRIGKPATESRCATLAI